MPLVETLTLETYREAVAEVGECTEHLMGSTINIAERTLKVLQPCCPTSQFESELDELLRSLTLHVMVEYATSQTIVDAAARLGLGPSDRTYLYDVLGSLRD